MIDINVELDNDVKTYQFPTSWSEVTVEQFCNLYTINREIHTGMFYTFEAIHKLTGIDREIIEQIVSAAASSDYGIRDLIHGVIQSRVFTHK